MKVAGAGHSFTDIACTDGVMVDMAGMRRVLQVDGDEVTVEAGITLRELGEELRARGLAMENQGDVDPQTIAGAISTATHGTGGRFGNLSSQVAGIRLVDGTGELRELRDGDELRAARVSLGALGAIAAVTLRCVPAFTIHRIDEPRPLDDVLPRLDELVDANDHWEAFVMPYTRRALTLTSERTDRAPEPPGRVAELVRDVVLENAVLGLFCRTGRAFPRLIPCLNRAPRRADEPHGAARRQQPGVREHAAGALHRDGVRDPARARRRGARARAGADRAPPPADRLPDRAARGAPDDALLSTAYERPTAYIAVHQYVGMEFETYFRAVEAIMDEYGGRPHWGKRHYQSAATLEPRYPEWERFQEVRERFDPGARGSRTTTSGACSADAAAAAQHAVERELAAVDRLRQHPEAEAAAARWICCRAHARR